MSTTISNIEVHMFENELISIIFFTEINIFEIITFYVFKIKYQSKISQYFKFDPPPLPGVCMHVGKKRWKGKLT